jgi:DNA-nicking Smr family endonuclease
MPRTRPERLRLPQDAALWQEAVRDVAPLPRRPRSRPVTSDTAGAEGVAPPAAAARRGPGSPPFDRAAGLDRATAERLKRGLWAIEARLDLHGMTQPEAHRALAEFVGVSSSQGRRCVLVVTGRGLGRDQPGILKSAVPRWLDEAVMRRQILAVAAAQPRHGGAGALYLLLRRRR